MGRPAQNGTAYESAYLLRLHADQRRRWRKVAKMAGMSLAEWIRSLCEHASEKSTRRT